MGLPPRPWRVLFEALEGSRGDCVAAVDSVARRACDRGGVFCLAWHGAAAVRLAQPVAIDRSHFNP